MSGYSVSFGEEGFTITDHPDIPLTSRTVPALAQAFIADGDIESFGKLLHNASLQKDPTSLLSGIKISNIKVAIKTALAAPVNSDDGIEILIQNAALTQIADAVRTIPKLSAAFTPEISGLVIERLRTEGETIKYASWYQPFASFAHAIADEPSRRAILKPEMVAEAARELAQHSHSVLTHYREPLDLYNEGYAGDFFKLAIAVKNDDRLNAVIEAKDVGKSAKAILHTDLNKIKKYAYTDEGYPTYPARESVSMHQFARLAEQMLDAREDWKAAIAEQIDPFIQSDRDGHAGFYLRDIIEAHPYLKQASHSIPSNG